MTVYNPTENDLKWRKSLGTMKMSKMDLALCHAAKNNQIWHLQQLIDHYATPHTVSIIIAAEKGHSDAVALMLEHCKNSELCLDIAADSSLRKDNLNMFKTLVKNGLDAHRERELYLRYASLEGGFEIFSYLMQDGADIKDAETCITMSVDYQAHTQEKLSALRNFQKRYQNLFEQNDTVDRILKKAHQGKINTEELCQHNSSGNSPLHIIAAQNKLDLIFKASLWQGKKNDMIALWEQHVPNSAKQCFCIKHIISDINRKHLATSNQIKLKKRPTPKP